MECSLNYEKFVFQPSSRAAIGHLFSPAAPIFGISLMRPPTLNYYRPILTPNLTILPELPTPLLIRPPRLAIRDRRLALFLHNSVVCKQWSFGYYVYYFYLSL